MSDDPISMSQALRLLFEADPVIAYAIERREEEGIGLEDDWRSHIDFDLERWNDLLESIRVLLTSINYRYAEK